MTVRHRSGHETAVLSSRLRQPSRPVQRGSLDGFVRPGQNHRRTSFYRSIAAQPVRPAATLKTFDVMVIAPQPLASPAMRKQQRSQVLRRSVASKTPRLAMVRKKRHRLPSLRAHSAILIMACAVFAIGIGVSWQTFRTNNQATASVAALAVKENSKPGGGNGELSGSSAAVPSTTKPAVSSVAAYRVRPEAPRFIKITKLGVNARVKELGVLRDGSMGAPSNVYDAGWFNQSALPGQTGAMLIAGHVSSWTTKGIFYGIKTLVAGDKVEVERGDGQKFSYTIVSSETFDADKVDMVKALTSVRPGQPGLNLITCAGKVKPGTNEFDKRTIVYAVQN